jgi:glutamyl-tRNA synthetase/glutamyl-Q tRNA(Asp) synthetase
VLTRFAPAPTGWLHLGHVLNAEYVWGAGAPIVLRIEDHDRERCRPEYEAGIVEDLDWLGYRADFPLVRQSERDAIYRDAAESLNAQGLLYACGCTRKQIDDRRATLAPPSSDLAPRDSLLDPGAPELVYDGHCRDRGLALSDGVGWRLRVDPGAETFVDARLGPQQQEPARQCGDVLIRDRLGNWTYQFVASVDDFRQGIDLVIRGEDLLASTGRQIRIARLLGRATPATFLHHSLLMKSPGQKLSKSDGDTGIRELRARGWTPVQVKAAARQGGFSIPRV